MRGPAQRPAASISTTGRQNNAMEIGGVGIDEREEARSLLASLKRDLPELEALLAESSSHWGYEDPIYRFYHQSWKVYGIQEATSRIVERLKALAPDRPLDGWFTAIVEEGTGRRFSVEDNRRWPVATRPILEAFFHARYFLEMAVKYGRELERPPQIIPSGWAAILCLYGLR